MRFWLRRIRFIYLWARYGREYGEVFHVPEDPFIEWLMVERYKP